MQICPGFNYSTGYEQIQANQQKAESILLLLITITIFACQFAIVIFLLPIRKLRHAVKELDLDVMEIIEKVTEKKPDDTFMNGINKAQNSGPLDHLIVPKPVFVHIKRTAGGFATVVIIAIIICVFTGMLLMQYFTTGNVTSARSTFDLRSRFEPIIGGHGSVGLVVPRNRGKTITINAISKCNVEMNSTQTINSCYIDFTNSNQFVIVDVGQLINLTSNSESCEMYATVCANKTNTRKPLHVIDMLTPVKPTLGAIPPPGVFVATNQAHSAPFSDDHTSSQVPVLRFSWTWIQMQAGPLLHFLNLPSDYYLQAKVSSSNYMRRVNSTIIDGTFESYWPECSFTSTDPDLAPLFSFEVEYEQQNFMTSFFKVQYNPILSWLFTVLVTIGSLTSLRNVLRFLFIIFAEYWSQAGVVMWILFVVYTSITALIFISLQIYGQEFLALSWISGWIAVGLWAVVLIDVIRRSKNKCLLRRQGYEPIPTAITADK